MRKIETEKDRFVRAIRVRAVKDIMSHIKKGTDINTNADGIRVFESLFSSGKPDSLIALDLVLEHPKWNPNYQMADFLHPEERAMLHRKESIALRIIQHPNFDKGSYPRVIQSAKRFKSRKVLQFLADKEHMR